MKNSGVAWIGKIPDDWNLIRLKDICINKKEIAGEKSFEYERLALTLNGVVKRPKDDQDGLQPKEFDTYQILNENDFVFKMIDLQNISTSRVGLSPYTGLVSPAYIRFAPKNDNQFNDFIHYYLLSLWHNCVYNKIAGDGVRSALNANDMGNLKCPYPLEKKQRKIVEFLNEKIKEIDSLIEIENHQIEKLSEYIKTVVNEVVTKGLRSETKMKKSGVSWIDMIPNDWKVMPLKALFRCGKGLPITKANLTENGIKVISYGQIHAKYNNPASIDDRIIRYVPDYWVESNPECLVHNSDFIFADTSEDVSGSGDFVYIDRDDEIFAGYHCIVLKAKKHDNKKYLAYLFMSQYWKNQIQCKVNGVKLFSISQSILMGTSVILPPEQEQREIVRKLDELSYLVSETINNKKKKIEKLEEYKKSLIYECVTGKKVI